MDEEGFIKVVPKRLYHYTSLESLAMILKERTIRFTRLDLVNDPEEAESCDLPDARKLVFASCWTAQSRESLPMWKMYTPERRAVRISMPWDMFDTSGFSWTKDHNLAIHYLRDSHSIEKEDGRNFRTAYLNGPVRIAYSNRAAEHVVKCIEVDNLDEKIELTHLGNRKRAHWGFEREWRYKMLADFASLVNYNDSSDDVCKEYFRKMKYGGEHVKTKYLYVKLSKLAFNAMRIRLGPSPDDSTKIIVGALLDKYNQKAKIEDSKILINWS